MFSLKIKILGIVVFSLVLAIGLTTWHNLRTQNAMLAKLATEHSRGLAETIHNSFITTMAAGENAKVAEILGRIRRAGAIEVVRIFNPDGRILISADPIEIGDFVPTEDLLAFHPREDFSQHLHHETETYCSIMPIRNAPVCHQCHDPDKEILGILNVHTSLKNLEILRQKGREATVLSSLGMLILAILIITGFFLLYVDKPVRRLVKAMTQVERGDFDRAVAEPGNTTEMNLLAAKFNVMVERLRELIETKVRQEKELAIHQEKLAHHEEIQNMNITLEERLKEIEYLNITLEERIEEIEEANYKITDLASELEDKNTTLQRAVNRLSALYKMGLTINSTMDLDRLFDQLLHKSLDTLGARIAYLLLLDPEAKVLNIGGIAGTLARQGPGIGIPLRPGGVSKWVIEHQQPLLIKDVHDTEEFNTRSLLGFDRETVICAPLIIKGEVIGTLTAANKLDGSFFTPDDLELLSTIAAQASVAINNARLYEEQQQTYLNTVQALVSAIEASDAYTRGHSERVTRYSLAIARRMNLDSKTVKRLEQAAILHDIGKIGIDVGLLHKKESLSGEDIEILRQHPLIGVRILEPIHFLREVREIIAQHHERFDGQGYPCGIDGDQLLLEARILTVADTFDAMTSDRPYRKALAQNMAVQEIEENAGSQFDPEVTAAFAALYREGELQA